MTGLNVYMGGAPRVFELATPAQYTEVWALGGGSNNHHEYPVTYTYTDDTTSSGGIFKVNTDGDTWSTPKTYLGTLSMWNVGTTSVSDAIMGQEGKATIDPDPTKTLKSIATGQETRGGWGYIMAFSGAEVVPPIPEPAGLGLMGVALLALRRRRS